MVTGGELNKLRELQDILSEKIQVEHEIQELPKQLGAQEEALTRMKKDFIEKNQDYERLRTAEFEMRGLLAEAESAREKAERTISEINTQREYEALDKERRAAEEKETLYRKEVQQKERSLMELDEDIQRRTALIKQQENDLTAFHSKIDAEIAEKKNQLDGLLIEEKKLTDGLDTEVVFKFERIIRNKMGLGIVAIKGNVCMGCHMILPAQFANNVRLGEEFVFCPYCSRILFFEESSEGEEMFFNADDSGSLADLDDMDDEDDDDAEGEEEEEKVSADFDG